MQTELNIELKKYFDETNIRNINIKSIRKYFPDIQITNVYGGLLHGAVYEKFDEDKVLKFIQVLLKNGVNPNLQGEYTGYNYIQLALYGYTDALGDYSYSTEFIVHLIELGRKYGLDVQAFDHDKDSIVHTALASEVFTGDTIAVIDALGNDFDLKCVDNHDHNIYEALQEYLDEAKNSHNQSWFDRLTACSEEIKQLVEISKFDLTTVDLEIRNLKKELLEISKQSSVVIVKNYKKILDLEVRFEFIIKNKTHFTGKVEDEHFIDEINRVVESSIRGSLEQVRLNPNRKQLQNFLDLSQDFQFSSLYSEFKKILLSYEETIQMAKESFHAAENLFELEGLQKKLPQFTDDEVLLEFQTLFQELSGPFTTIISEIESLIVTSDVIDLAINNTCWSRHDLKKLSLKELKNEKDTLIKRIRQMRTYLKNDIQDRTRTFTKEICKYAQPNLFTRDEIYDFLIKSISQEMGSETKSSPLRVRRKKHVN